jgi:ethanolamine utilization protein EutQ (cupin superfamily)
MAVLLRKVGLTKWEKVGEFSQAGESQVPRLDGLQEVGVSVLFGAGGSPHCGAAFEKWPPMKTEWHYESGQVFYIVSGGPLRVTWDGQTLEGGPGDVFLFSRGTEVTFEVVKELVALAVYHPSFEEILHRYREHAVEPVGKEP